MSRTVPNAFASDISPTLPDLDADFAALTPAAVLPCTATGTNAIVLTPVAATLTVTGYTDKDRYSFDGPANSTGAVTVQVSGQPALKLFKSGGVAQAGSGDIVAGQYYDIAYVATLDGNNGGFVIVSAIVQGIPTQTVNSQAGNVAYTIVAGDNTKAILLASSTSGINVSLPGAFGTFAPSWYADLVCLGSSFGSAIVAMAVTSSLIDGASQIVIPPGTSNRIVSDGANFQVLRGQGRIAQMAVFETGGVATGTTQIPADNTIPQNTEGDQYMVLPFAAVNPNSTLIIDIFGNFATSAGAATAFTVSTFQSGTANALAAMVMNNTGSANNSLNLAFRHKMLAGSMAPTAFSVRAGAAGAGTTTFNGQGGSGILGGALASSITITEYLP